LNPDSPSTVQLRPWSDEDLPLLHSLLGNAEMTEHLGGPETPEQIVKRHGRYLALADPAEDQMFAILVGPHAEPAGSIGYWPREEQGQSVYETGWSVLPSFQGQGVATRAIHEMIAILRSRARYRYVHAYPSIVNLASNAICRKAGFSLKGQSDFEYPKGHWMSCNDWQFDLQHADPDA
jgi:RimJ/RimL family protein N-acetyltransferase